MFITDVAGCLFLSLARFCWIERSGLSLSSPNYRGAQLHTYLRGDIRTSTDENTTGPRHALFPELQYPAMK